MPGLLSSRMEKFKRSKSKPTGASAPDWSRTGSFMNKPDQGWIHPDEQLLPEGGICYGVRYIGCLAVKESMKNLDFDTRTILAREVIHRVAEAAGLKTVNKKRKIDKKIGKMLGDSPNMQYAGSNVNLTITTESLSLMIMESGEIIANHQMPGISFASGGDADTLDFVAYVAKDPYNGRACQVFECGGGLAEDVITTIGQAFELRFKEFLKHQPKTITLPDRVEHPLSATETSAWGEEPEYYNDRPGALPPSPTLQPAPLIPLPPVPQYSSPRSNLPIGDVAYYSSCTNPPPTLQFKEGPMPPGMDILHRGQSNSGLDGVAPLIDLSDPTDGPSIDNPEAGAAAGSARIPVANSNEVPEDVYSVNPTNIPVTQPKSDTLDPFDMEPFANTLSSAHKDSAVRDSPQHSINHMKSTTPNASPKPTPRSGLKHEQSHTHSTSATQKLATQNGFSKTNVSGSSALGKLKSSIVSKASQKGSVVGDSAAQKASVVSDSAALNGGHSEDLPRVEERNGAISLNDEIWFHGAISRRQAELMLKSNGDFLVRESSASAGQYVLSGKQNGSLRHLLLVDPEGVVRTKDHVFDSVSHLINYHRDNGLPIVSQESELFLRQPVLNT